MCANLGNLDWFSSDMLMRAQQGRNSFSRPPSISKHPHRLISNFSMRFILDSFVERVEILPSSRIIPLTHRFLQPLRHRVAGTQKNLTIYQRVKIFLEGTLNLMHGMCHHILYYVLKKTFQKWSLVNGRRIYLKLLYYFYYFIYD